MINSLIVLKFIQYLNSFSRKVVFSKSILSVIHHNIKINWFKILCKKMYLLISVGYLQKLPPEVFYQKSCS